MNYLVKWPSNPAVCLFVADTSNDGFTYQYADTNVVSEHIGNLNGFISAIAQYETATITLTTASTMAEALSSHPELFI